MYATIKSEINLRRLVSEMNHAEFKSLCHYVTQRKETEREIAVANLNLTREEIGSLDNSSQLIPTIKSVRERLNIGLTEAYTLTKRYQVYMERAE